MKTRQGFVSNSSTSSFVVLGVKVDKIDNEELEEWLHEGHEMPGIPSYVGICSLASEGPPYAVGMVIAHGDEDSMPDLEIDIEKTMEAVNRFLKHKGLPTEPIKLYTGSRMC